MKNLPLTTIRIGALTATVWKNGDYYSTALSRSFRNEAGEWNETASFNHADLPVVATLATAAEAFIRTQK
jgi:hypothetical protein